MRPAALGHKDQTLLLQALDGLADHGPADAELLAQGPLGRQELAGFERAGDDQIDQFLDHHGAEPVQGEPSGGEH